jgi:predicted  nucleic acid-binding Zn-ribbon protein
MAVCGDKRVKLQNQIDDCEATMMSLGDDAADEKGRFQAKLHGLHEELQDEAERRKRWTVRIPCHPGSTPHLCDRLPHVLHPCSL